MYFCQKNAPLFLKNIITYILILFISFAYSYETIEYFSKAIGDDSITWADDFDCEENSSEKEDPNEEKANFDDDWSMNNKYPNNQLIPKHFELGILSYRQHNRFSSDDYGQEVYSPPEVI